MSIKERVDIEYNLRGNAGTGLKGLFLNLKALVTPTALLTAGIGLLSISLNKMITAAEESRKVMAQTEAVLKSTGGAAGVTSQEVSDLALQMSRLTNFDDEAVQSAENLLLTFTKIGKDIFPQATETVLDMSTALGQDLNSSAIQLGKALQDPINGVTALRRVGVNFTEQQKEQIKTLVESGRRLDAQKIILKELATEFGGSARAAQSGTDKLKNSISNLAESIGTKLNPAFQEGSKKIANFLDKITDYFNKSGSIENFSLENVRQEINKTQKSINDKTKAGLKSYPGERSDPYADTNTGLKNRLDLLKKREAELNNQPKTPKNKNSSSNDDLPRGNAKDPFGIDSKQHEKDMAKLRNDNQYTIDSEIAGYQKLLEKHKGNEEKKLDLETKIIELRSKKKEEETKRTLELMDMEFQRKKELGKTTVQDEIAFEKSKLEVKNLSEQQKQAVSDKTYNLNTQKLVSEMNAQKSILDTFKSIGESKLSITESVNEGLLESTKKLIIAEADAFVGKFLGVGTAEVAGSLGTNPMGWAKLAAAGVLSTGIRAAMNTIKLAKGGTVMPSPGGTLATIGEAGRPERVEPLDPSGLSARDRAIIRELSGGSGGDIYLDSTKVGKIVGRGIRRLNNTGQLARAN